MAEGQEGKGFTLAEVLITLAIIGVVAALTIPTVVRNYQKQEAVTKLKKVYTIMSQGFQTAMATDGVMRLDDTNLADSIVGTSSTNVDGTRQAAFEKELRKYFKISKYYGPGEYVIAFTDRVSTNSLGPVMVLQDGNVVRLTLNKSCVEATPEQLTTIKRNGGNLTGTCGEFYLDFLHNKPVTLGKTGGFRFIITNKGTILPFGSKDFAIYKDGDSWESSTQYYKSSRAQGNVKCNNNTGRKFSCAAKIMDDGWQIKDDYPW